ncbi:osmoprotectant transport system permease protein [Chelatococcus caeni]|uniref:Osmoprotectant transport system permease protein n=1 Tax=Chelatococcus caeni TaxID=1348468 RepID=A0A840BQJ4_9HYPH|nr:osmoprotectant transport system permease protein [Chelatococcus caeni]
MIAQRRRLLRIGAAGIAVALFAVMVLAPEAFERPLAALTKFGQPAIYDRDSILALTLSHMGIVAAASLAALVIALAIGIFVTRPAGAQYLPLARAVANLGQTFPPIAMLAVAVPLTGFGARPTLVALFAYGLLPIFENTIAGLKGVSPQVVEAARGMGMTGRRILREIELPLALPVIIAGFRVSIIVSIGTATIGSTVGAKGLGEIIIAGLQADNLAYVLQGGVLVAMLAILVDLGLGFLERRARQPRSA